MNYGIVSTSFFFFFAVVFIFFKQKYRCAFPVLVNYRSFSPCCEQRAL
jgi:hypothetical protein